MILQLKVAAKEDATTYSTQGLPKDTTFRNNIFALAPSIEVERANVLHCMPAFHLHGIITS